VGLVALAALLWTWCALLLLTPYEVEEKPDDPYPEQCESRLLTDRGTANEGLWKGDLCQNERDWPEALAVLGLSVPLHHRWSEYADERTRRSDAGSGQDHRRTGGAVRPF
jgi:hypothetical protein